MGKLDCACGYLSGPMEFVADHGIEWRRKFIQLCHEKQLNIDLIDPTNKPGGHEMSMVENRNYQETLQKAGRWKELRDYVAQYRRFDLRYVDNSDFIVAVIDRRVPQWGTSDELYTAEDQHKPMFFICEGGLYNLPRWLFDVIDLHEDGTTNVYETVEAVVDELVALDEGIKPMSNKWVLVRKYIESDRR